MIPVYQTITDPDKGNCMQAAMASLLELPLNEVPHFREREDWLQIFLEFLENSGYNFEGTLDNVKQLGLWGKDRFPEIKDMPGIKGFFYATVYSPKYFDISQLTWGKRIKAHAVIIDKDFRIVHDPNPENKDIFEYPLHEFLDYNGITSILMLNEKQ